MSFLSEVLKQKERELAQKMDVLPLEELMHQADHSPIRDFHGAILGGERIIAEVKKRSPKIEQFRQAGCSEDLAAIYERCGATAISIVTDERNFGTSLADARRTRGQTTLPVLVKDFFFHPYQIHEARTFGADAVLLISRVLTVDRLKSLLLLTHELGMSALVEVHSEEDLGKAKKVGAPIIGINNRDLDSLEVSLETTRRLIDLVGDGTVVVSESGIRSRTDIQDLSALGVDAFLVGGALLESTDPGGLLRSLLGDVSSAPRKHPRLDR
jgi:indole-3-glycerol phosphate synthase